MGHRDCVFQGNSFNSASGPADYDGYEREAHHFFVTSASAKAFLMMPILAPLADLVGLTRQTVVLAFDFGDGFSNMIYPSNALLLIALGFTVVSYPKWLKWTLPIQGIMLSLTVLFLMIAVSIGFGPF